MHFTFLLLSSVSHSLCCCASPAVLLCSALLCSALFCSVFGSSRVECGLIAAMPSCALDWRKQATDSHHRVLVMFMGSTTQHTQWSYTNKAMIHRKSKNGIKNRKATAASRKNGSTAKEITTIIKLSILSRSLTTLISLPCARSLFVFSLSDKALPLPAPLAPAYQVHPVQIPAINLTYTRYTQQQTTIEPTSWYPVLQYSLLYSLEIVSSGCQTKLSLSYRRNRKIRCAKTDKNLICPVSNHIFVFSSGINDILSLPMPTRLFFDSIVQVAINDWVNLKVLHGEQHVWSKITI